MMYVYVHEQFNEKKIFYLLEGTYNMPIHMPEADHIEVIDRMFKWIDAIK